MCIVVGKRVKHDENVFIYGDQIRVLIADLDPGDQQYPDPQQWSLLQAEPWDPGLRDQGERGPAQARTLRARRHQEDHQESNQHNLIAAE